MGEKALRQAAALSNAPARITLKAWRIHFGRRDPAVTARCLVVDDDAQVREALVRVVHAQGLECLSAALGRCGPRDARDAGRGAVLISDIHMPGMDGVALLEEVRRSYPDIAVIMLTGVADVSTAVECLKHGALDYIAKPMVLDEVRARVDKALDKRELILQNRFYQQHLEDEVRRQRARIEELFIDGVQTLVHALEAKDAYTSGHSQRVREYAVKTAVHLGFTGGCSTTSGWVANCTTSARSAPGRRF